MDLYILFAKDIGVECIWGILLALYDSLSRSRQVSIGILENEREPGVGKLGWRVNFDTRL